MAIGSVRGMGIFIAALIVFVLGFCLTVWVVVGQQQRKETDVDKAHQDQQFLIWLGVITGIAALVAVGSGIAALS